IRLALDAQRGDRAGAQAFDADGFSARFAHAVDAVLDALQRFFDFADQFALAVADAQCRVAVRLERRAIGRFGEVLFAVDHAAHRPPRLTQQLLPPALQQIPEPVDVALIQTGNLPIIFLATS